MKPASQRDLWVLAVLALLRERDMHPYEMRVVLRERHKDERLLLKAGSLYHAVSWLERQERIARVARGRQGNRPERTVYRITTAGGRALLESLRDLLSTPGRESNSFAVALDHAVHLPQAEAAELLEKRAVILASRLKTMQHVLEVLPAKIGRINLLEVEFEHAVVEAELSWLKSIVRDIRSGELRWDIQQILKWLRAATSAKGKQPKLTKSSRHPPEPNQTRKQL